MYKPEYPHLNSTCTCKPRTCQNFHLYNGGVAKEHLFACFFNIWLIYNNIVKLNINKKWICL